MRKFGSSNRVEAVKAPVAKVRKSAKVPRLSFISKLVAPLRPVFRPLAKLVPPYFKNAWAELKLVTWPNRLETWRLTMAVFIFAIVFAFMVAGVDKLLDKLFRTLILK